MESEAEVKLENGETKGEEGKVSMLKLFKLADGADVTLMVVGTIAAVAIGISQPMMTFIFGQIVDAFGGADSDNVLRRVDKVCLKSYMYYPVTQC
ncbi:hypothetical protein LUZ60_008126 [Juncus effusus]|nr:hypothetical protein LUZ60_008126 [Juncus effusus]